MQRHSATRVDLYPLIFATVCACSPFGTEIDRAAHREQLDDIAALAANEVWETRLRGVLMSVQDDAPSRASTELTSYFGGVPTRFYGESWPVIRDTGKPLTFVGQFVRTELNAEFMGDIQMMQLVPPRELMIGDGGHLSIFLDKHRPLEGFAFTLQMY